MPRLGESFPVPPSEKVPSLTSIGWLGASVALRFGLTTRHLALPPSFIFLLIVSQSRCQALLDALPVSSWVLAFSMVPQPTHSVGELTMC